MTEQERQALFDKKVEEIENHLVTAERALHELRTWLEQFKTTAHGHKIGFRIL